MLHPFTESVSSLSILLVLIPPRPFTKRSAGWWDRYFDSGFYPSERLPRREHPSPTRVHGGENPRTEPDLANRGKSVSWNNQTVSQYERSFYLKQMLMSSEHHHPLFLTLSPYLLPVPELAPGNFNKTWQGNSGLTPTTPAARNIDPKNTSRDSGLCHPEHCLPMKLRALRRDLPTGSCPSSAGPTPRIA
ncbi:hypothetical protein NA57DRAFT_54315 [Rhizodiscina lignyota]|uniref:Uncharacterized protein n=1 Tax=Rhizodiscina lignyota TaxID=1504668 RepID=A0A9P4IKM4_9PEZI|nr:hypothetical protein NA57DRAFT_54315 [Rhizodiscina lignyota]